VNNQPIWPQLDEPDLVESGDDGVQMPVEQRDQIVVGNVAGRHDQEAEGTGAK